jgi:glycosyl hydrolase family 25
VTIHFPDLSHFRPGVPLAGVAALLTKATQGVDNVDPTYAGYKAQATADGVIFAGFHYVTTDDVQAQAAHAFAVIGPDVPAMWDFEKGGGTVAHMYGVHDAYVALGGTATLGYAPHWYLESLGSPSITGFKPRGLALISSAYTGYSDTGEGWNGYGGMTPTIWQYTDAGDCNGHSVDMNAFKGSLDELAAVIMGDLLMAMAWTDDVVPNPGDRADSPGHTPPGTNPTTQVAFALGDMWDQTYKTHDAVNAASVTLAAIAKTDSAALAAITAMAAALKAGGGNADDTAIIAAVNAVGTQESAAVTALQQQVAKLQADLLAAAKASAAALAA